MSTEINDPKFKASVEAGYEKRDVNIRGLLQFGFWMAVVIVITLIGMKLMFNYFNRTMSLGPPASSFVNNRQLPPSPRLQVEPHQELKDYCATQQKNVNGYGWVDQQSGVVRIPVDKAMEVVLAKGLPARSSGEAASASPVPVSPAFTPDPAGLQGPCGYLIESEGAPPISENDVDKK
jgi:hypothetical protein